MSVSVLMATYNEQDLLPHTLNHLLNFDNINELCIVDSFSKDETMNIIIDFIPKYLECGKKILLKQSEFKSIGEQYNKTIKMANGDILFATAVDETYPVSLDLLLYDLQNKLQHINAVRMNTINLVNDYNHFIPGCSPDPHVKIWNKRLNASFLRDIHELLTDDKGRNIHECYDSDILNVWDYPEYQHIVLKHGQFLKTDLSLIDKGKRWAELGMIAKSAEVGIILDEEWWVRGKGYWKNLVGEELKPEWKDK